MAFMAIYVVTFWLKNSVVTTILGFVKKQF